MPITIPCPFCHATNAPEPNDAAAATCTSCGTRLFLGKAIRMTGADFDRLLEASGTPVLADFHADWCAPCKIMEPVLEAAAQELEPALRIVKIDTDHEQALAGRHAVRGLPTFVLFKDAQETARRSGAAPLQDFLDWLRLNL